MKQILAFISFCFLIIGAAEVQAQDNPVVNKKDITITEKNGELYVENTTVAELEKLFKAVHYEDYIYMPSMMYPAIFLKKLPVDLDKMEDESYRNRLFIQLLAPVAIKVSQDVFAEREKMLKMAEEYEKNSTLTPEQYEQLDKWAEQYDIFTRLKDDRRTIYIFDELKKKLDIIPPSMLIGVAAVESNWGTSRPAREANSLYKEKVWFGEEPGLAPDLGEGEKDDYEFKIFDTIYDAMMSYSIKTNANVDFYYMRSYRSEMRRRDKVVSGRALAHSMVLSSQLKNFAGLLDYTITFYDMDNLDYAELMRLPE